MYQVLDVHTAASVLCFDLLKTKSLECLLSHFPLTTSLLFTFTTFCLHALFAWIVSGLFLAVFCFFLLNIYYRLLLSFVCIFHLVFVSWVWTCFHLFAVA